MSTDHGIMIMERIMIISGRKRGRGRKVKQIDEEEEEEGGQSLSYWWVRGDVGGRAEMQVAPLCGGGWRLPKKENKFWL